MKPKMKPKMKLEQQKVAIVSRAGEREEKPRARRAKDRCARRLCRLSSQDKGEPEGAGGREECRERSQRGSVRFGVKDVTIAQVPEEARGRSSRVSRSLAGAMDGLWFSAGSSVREGATRARPALEGGARLGAVQAPPQGGFQQAGTRFCQSAGRSDGQRGRPD